MKETRLKDYKGFVITKVVEYRNITYIATTQDGDLFDCSTELKKLKRNIDLYVR